MESRCSWRPPLEKSCDTRFAEELAGRLRSSDGTLTTFATVRGISWNSRTTFVNAARLRCSSFAAAPPRHKLHLAFVSIRFENLPPPMSSANPVLAEQIGFGKNLAKVLVADGKTLIVDLRVDLFIQDAFGYQGLPLDWISLLSKARFSKTLLYHQNASLSLGHQRCSPKYAPSVWRMFHIGLIID